MSTVDDPRLAWHGSTEPDVWAAQVADFVAAALREALSSHAGKVRLLVSGGTTPAPAYRLLAAIDLDWSRIVIALVDDRDVTADDSGSNARAIREYLLRDHAADASFMPLRELADSAADAIDAANRWWQESADQPVAAAVLGMGDDGHTASLFPGSRNLDEVLASSSAYALVDATGCAVAGVYHQRLSLTPAGLAAARQCLLLIRGDRKREVLLAALADGPVSAMPLRLAWSQPISSGTARAPLQVFWCAN